MTALRIFSYLPDPRIWKATITGRLCDVEIEVRGASPRELSQWLWDFDARPIAEVPRESWSVRNALVESASPVKSYIRQTRFSRRILSVPFRLRSVQTVAPDFLRDLKLSRVGLIVKRGPDDLRQGNSDLPRVGFDGSNKLRSDLGVNILPRRSGLFEWTLQHLRSCE